MDHTGDARLDQINRPPPWRHVAVEKIERGAAAAVHGDRPWVVWPRRDERRIGSARRRSLPFRFGSVEV